MASESRKKTGRNDPCPCGSGKKYKFCCLQQEVPPIGPVRAAPKGAEERVAAPRLSPEVTRVFLATAKFGFAEDVARESLEDVNVTADNLMHRFANVTHIREKKADVGDYRWNLRIDLANIQELYGRRMTILYADAIDSINRMRLHLAALALRALLEVQGALIYYERRILKCMADGYKSPADRDELSRLISAALYGSRFRWNQFTENKEEFLNLLREYAKATDQKDEPVPDVLQKSSAAFVAEVEKQAAKKWPQRKGSIRLVYALLSDMCHPSLGANIALEGMPTQSGWVTRRYSPSEQFLGFFLVFAAMPVLTNAATVAAESILRLMEAEAQLAR